MLFAHPLESAFCVRALLYCCGVNHTRSENVRQQLSKPAHRTRCPQPAPLQERCESLLPEKNDAAIIISNQETISAQGYLVLVFRSTHSGIIACQSCALFITRAFLITTINKYSLSYGTRSRAKKRIYRAIGQNCLLQSAQ